MPQHLNEMLKLFLMVVEGVLVGRDLASFWKIGRVTFHEPHGADFSTDALEDKIGLPVGPG